MDTGTESWKHSEHQTVAREIKHGFRGNGFAKNGNGTLKAV
jgi:hypothetical protein